MVYHQWSPRFLHCSLRHLDARIPGFWSDSFLSGSRRSRGKRRIWGPHRAAVLFPHQGSSAQGPCSLGVEAWCWISPCFCTSCRDSAPWENHRDVSFFWGLENGISQRNDEARYCRWCETYFSWEYHGDIFVGYKFTWYHSPNMGSNWPNQWTNGLMCYTQCHKQSRFGDGWNPTHRHCDFADGLGNGFSTFIITCKKISTWSNLSKRF